MKQIFIFLLKNVKNLLQKVVRKYIYKDYLDKKPKKEKILNWSQNISNMLKQIHLTLIFRHRPKKKKKKNHSWNPKQQVEHISFTGSFSLQSTA